MPKTCLKKIIVLIYFKRYQSFSVFDNFKEMAMVREKDISSCQSLEKNFYDRIMKQLSNELLDNESNITNLEDIDMSNIFEEYLLKLTNYQAQVEKCFASAISESEPTEATKCIEEVNIISNN